MEHATTSMTAHYGDVRRAVLGPIQFDRRFNTSPVRIQVEYLNNLQKEVVIGLRSGLKFRLPPVPDFQSNRLIVRVTLEFNQDVRFDMARVLSVVNETMSMELNAMRDALSVYVEDPYQNRLGNIVLDYSVGLDQLMQQGGTLYYHELDCVMSIEAFDEVPPHPYSEEGMRQQVMATSLINQTDSCGYAVEIVDPTGKYGKRYLNIGGRIGEITPITTDHARRPGIYILSNRFEGNGFNVGVKTEYYSLDTPVEDTLGLYRTYEDAKYNGDQANARKERLAKLDLEIQQQKKENQHQQQLYEQEMLRKEDLIKELQRQHEAKLQELKEEQLRADYAREAERQRLKDYYEDRAYMRKDQSEVVKILPTIVVGIGAIFLAIKSLL